ncbi:hypothetical protein M595_3522 [Lyngbya aestuarii BL J]|uniref:Uncharacterized protein n=1 Tax=Lyngbya aestuarii BL J TaxID=1348334 RepID=U7QHG4_9CYAN|nr:hypothetical protein M595_3522 [Lyngbya aestuarii BL J]
MIAEFFLLVLYQHFGLSIYSTKVIIKVEKVKSTLSLNAIVGVLRS